MFKTALMMAAVPAALIAPTPVSALVFLGNGISSPAVVTAPEALTLYRTNWVTPAWDKRVNEPTMTSPDFVEARGDPPGLFLLPMADLPEPMSWAMMVIGMGAIGWSLRAGQRDVAFS